MPRRKGSAVSLAGAARVARGHEDATPERLARAVGEGGEAGVDPAGVRRIGDPFDALRSRNLLDRLDIAANETLWHAGDRLRRHWHLSRLDALSAVDLTRPSVDGGGGGGTPGEAAQRHCDELRRAAEAVGARLMPYVEGVILAGLPVSGLRGLVGDSAHARTADALALERLREGLHRLCELWRMRPDARPLPIASWRAEAQDAVPAEDANG